MNQTLHIFAKDTRRFWPEILLSFALLAAFAHVAPHAFQPGMRNDNFVLYPIFNIVLNALLPITWWVLVSRVTHEENLVGDRQFWITRPYRWPSLLAAKILFLVAFILGPFALMQSLLLFAVGFHPSALLPGLLFSVALLGTLILLPLFALSTVTASFAKLTLTLLAILLTILLFEAIISARVPSIDTSLHTAWPYLLLSLVASGAIIAVQYARRRTAIARGMLLASIILLIVLPVLLATKLAPLYFPVASDSRPAPVAFAFDPNPGRRLKGGAREEKGEYVSISLPVTVTGVAANSLAVSEGSKVTLTSADGKTYDGPWRRDSRFYRPNDSRYALQYIYFLVPRDFFDQVSSTTVAAHITLGVGQLKPQPTVTAPFPAEKAALPGIGICAGVRTLPDYDASSYALACTVALRSPAYTEVTARWSDTKCNQPQPPVDQLILGKGMIGSYNSDPADFGLSPLIRQQVGFSNSTVRLPDNGSRPRYLCAGTPLTFTPYRLTYRTSVDFTAANVKLADYLPEAMANVQVIQSGRTTVTE